MARSNFPGGFRHGFSVKQIPIDILATGNVYYVSSNTTVPDRVDVGDDTRGNGSFNFPFATIGAAISACTAGQGDIIYVKSGHAETVTNATAIALSKSDVALIGLGTGDARPTITFATNTTANIPISGANSRISNFIFKCNIASQVAMLTTTADGIIIDECDFREGTATGLNFITVGAADGDSDRLRIHNCRFFQPTAGNGDHAIEFLKDMTDVSITDCDIDGDFDEGSIAIPAGGNAQVNLQILRCNIKNRLTNVAAISINGTDSSGLIQDCLLRTDTQATALDSGSLAVDNVRFADETDQVSSVPILALQDSASNILGADDSDNAFASTNVAANRDGSVLERLEAIIANQEDDVSTNYIGVDDANNVAATSNVVANLDGSILERLEALMDPLGGYDPVLGFRVTKTSNLADGAGTDNLFTVTGRCLITHLSGEVTTVIGGAATMKLRDVTNSVDLCAATTIDSDAVGTMYALPGLTAEILNGTGGTPVVGSIPNVTTPSGNARLIIGNVQAPLTIAHVLDAADTGAVAWVLYYKPLTAASSIVAAA